MVYQNIPGCYGIPEDLRMLTNSHTTTLVFVTEIIVNKDIISGLLEEVIVPWGQEKIMSKLLFSLLLNGIQVLSRYYWSRISMDFSKTSHNLE
jgi:hypothetical protein